MTGRQREDLPGLHAGARRIVGDVDIHKHTHYAGRPERERISSALGTRLVGLGPRHYPWLLVGNTKLNLIRISGIQTIHFDYRSLQILNSVANDAKG